MKICIHQDSGRFVDKWIEYCKEHTLDYDLIDLFNNSIIEDVRKGEYTHLLFHLGTNNYRTDLIAKSIIYSLNQDGMNIFPNFDTYWHYDDKVRQKYLFEHYSVPHAKMHVFYDMQSAIKWIENGALFPFVFKLRRGSGSNNVILIKSRSEALKYVRKMFGNGINPLPSTFNDYKTKLKKHSNNRDWIALIKRLPITIINNIINKNSLSNEMGYFYAQDFYPNNKYDVRVVVVGNKAWSLRRYVRKNDFRASGSGNIDYDKNLVDKEILKIAFDSAKKMKLQAIAFDFIYDFERKPKIIECSYCWPSGSFIEDCEGYWDIELNHHDKFISAEKEIIMNLLNEN